MSNREHRIRAFLADCGWANADRKPLLDDASYRQYERLHCREADRRAVLMNAPPESCGSLQPFRSTTSFLRELGLSAPEIYEDDESAGFMLLEDLGDDLVARLLERTPDLETEIYSAAIDVLAVFRSGTDLGSFPKHSPETQSELASLAIDWYLPNATGAEPSADLRSEFKGIVEGLVAGMGAPSLFVHRDFHAENIIWLPERDGLKRVGLLDYQDGAVGYRAYDLVSLLEDARRDIPDLLRSELVMRFAQAAGDRNGACRNGTCDFGRAAEPSDSGRFRQARRPRPEARLRPADAESLEPSPARSLPSAPFRSGESDRAAFSVS